MFNNVRIATIEDVDLILDMTKEFLAVSKYKEYLVGDDIRPLIETFVTSDGTDKIVLLHGDQGMIVGLTFPLLFVGPKVAAEIAWWVIPEARGSNVGAELLTAFEDWAKLMNCPLITMDSQNEKLGKYYESKGYKLASLSYMKEI